MADDIETRQESDRATHLFIKEHRLAEKRRKQLRRLIVALRDVAYRVLDDGTPCFCCTIRYIPSGGLSHEPTCVAARRALAEIGESND